MTIKTPHSHVLFIVEQNGCCLVLFVMAKSGSSITSRRAVPVQVLDIPELIGQKYSTTNFNGEQQEMIMVL
jgi:hypothetical protein